MDMNFLYEELLKRGYSKTQAGAKVISGVVDILCEAGDKYDVVRELETQIEILQDKKDELVKWHKFYQERQRKEEEDRKREMEATNEYIDGFYAALNSCETAEGRDRLRLAQMFRNSIDLDTKYDNTAYIVGLAGILSGEKVAVIPEIKKINKKLKLGHIL